MNLMTIEGVYSVFSDESGGGHSTRPGSKDKQGLGRDLGENRNLGASSSWINFMRIFSLIEDV